MSRALINFLIGLSWLVLYITVIANWVREMGLIIPASIASWLMVGSIPVFIGIAMYVFDKKFYKKESLTWKAIYTGFVVWLTSLNQEQQKKLLDYVMNLKLSDKKAISGKSLANNSVR